jgi:hypothetical protein
LGDLGEFWGTSRKKVIPHSPGNEKSKFPKSPNLKEYKKLFLIYLIPYGRKFIEELETLLATGVK